MASMKKIAEYKGWEYNKNYTYGIEEGYVITGRQVIDLLNSANNCKLVYIPLSNITEEQAIKTVEFLKANKKELKVNAYEFNNHVLVLRLAEGLKGFTGEQMDYLVKTLVQFFKEQDIAKNPTCIYCNGQDDVNEVMKINKIQFHAHASCITKAQTELQQTKQNYHSQEKNYGMGMLGATIGALIGAIPWMLLEMFWGYAAILSIAIGYVAFIGYKKFGGVVTKTTKWLMILPIVFAVVVSNIVSITYHFIQNNIPVTIDNYVIAYTHPDISSELLGALFIGILFALVGYISVFRKVKSEEFDSVIE